MLSIIDCKLLFYYLNRRVEKKPLRLDEDFSMVVVLWNTTTAFHSVYDIKYHLVWITKYRRPVLSGEVARRCRTLISQIRKSQDVEILKGYVRRDHVHLICECLTVLVSKQIDAAHKKQELPKDVVGI